MTKEAVKKEGPVCLVCNKPLTDPESIALGVGPLCRAKGWTKEAVAAKMAELKQEKVPEGWIKLAEVANLCRAEDIPVSRLVRAIGGDRAMEDPIDPIFQVIYVGRSRYLSPEAVGEKGLAIMRDKHLGVPQPVKEPKPKKEKVAKAAKEPKKVDDLDIWKS